jgi:hypothetical protein
VLEPCGVSVLEGRDAEGLSFEHGHYGGDHGQLRSVRSIMNS